MSPSLPALGLFLGFTLALLPACSGSAGSPGEGDHLLEVAITPVFTVGSQAGDRWDALFRVGALAFDRDGRLFILDADAHRVLVVNPDGSHHLTFGTRGEGPGQLRMPMGLAVMEDGTVALFDMGHRGFLLFDREGSFLRSIPISMDEGTPGPRILPHGPDGLVSVSRGLTIRSTGSGPPSFPSSAPVRRFDLTPEARHASLYEAWIPPREMPASLNVSQGAGGPRVSGGPGIRAFEPQPLLAVLPDGRLALADSSTYRIRFLSPYGEELHQVSRAVPPQPVGEREREAERSRRLRDLDEGRGPRMQIQTSGPGGTVSLDQSQMGDMIRGQLESMDFWPEIPVLTSLAADPEGRLWAGRSGGVGTAGPTDLLGPDGRYMGTIPAHVLTPPDAFGPEDLAAWIRTDELDVPYVEVRRVRFPD